MPTRWPAHLAAALGAGRFIVAGATAGVLDWQGATIARLTPGGDRRHDGVRARRIPG